MRWIADALYLFAAILYAPVFIYRSLIGGHRHGGWGERFGAVPRLDAGRRRIWVHAVSLGEINATPLLIQSLRSSVPDVEVVVSTTTDTGFARAVQLYGRESVIRYPLDFSPVVVRALNRIAPTIIVLIELEVWYNLVTMAASRNIPVVVVNGRLTARSARRLGRLGAGARRMFTELAWVGAQDVRIAERFRGVGVAKSRVEITGSLKWDTAQFRDSVAGVDPLAAELGVTGQRPVWVCGSTGPGEEEIILDVYRRLVGALRERVGDRNRPGASAAPAVGVPILILVPRRPERFDEVARMISEAGFPCVRRSVRSGMAQAARQEADERCVILGDTTGELRKFYCLADVVFVGRSLVPMGGSDPIEAAALGKPIVAGPHLENFEVPRLALEQAGVLRIVQTGDELFEAVANLLGDPRRAREEGLRGVEVVRAHQGATKRTVARLTGLLAEADSHVAGGSQAPHGRSSTCPAVGPLTGQTGAAKL